MNQKELNEIRRRFKLDRSSISKIFGCYVNSNREIISWIDASMGLMQQEEQEMYLGLLKKALSVTLGKNLVDLVFTTAQVADSASAPLRIGAFSSISSTWLPRVLQEYHALYPEVTFDIQVGTNTLADWMLKGAVDLALGDAARCRAFRWFPLMDDPYFAVLPETLAPQRDGITQDELAAFPFVMAPMNALDSYLSVCPANQLRVNCDDDSTLLSMVAQGIGVTAMPQLCLQKLPENVRVLTLTPPMKRVLCVALPNLPSREANRFARFLCQKFSYQEMQ